MPKLSLKDAAAKVSANEGNRRRIIALASLRELELATKKKGLLPAAEVKRVWSEQLAALRDRLLSLPDRLAARIAGRDEAEVRAALRDELEEALRGIHAAAHTTL